MIKHLSLKAYGKINLGLDVLKKRDDGYHEVRMIMQTVGIFDRIDLIREDQPGIRVETNLFYLPTNENNLVYKAAKLLMDEFSISSSQGDGRSSIPPCRYRSIAGSPTTSRFRMILASTGSIPNFLAIP